MEPSNLVQMPQASGQDVPTPPTATPPSPIKIPSKHGHRFLVLYAVVLLAAALLGIIYAWQHGQVNSANKKNAALSTEVASLKQQVDTLNLVKSDSTNNNSPLDYATWKTFCDTTNNGCFRYPKDWTISGSSASNKTSETLSNANSTTTVNYENPYDKSGVDQVFYIVSINDLNTKSLGFKIIGRVLGNTPDYVIVDNSYVDGNHVEAGKSMSFMDSAVFTDRGKKSSTRFAAKPSDAAKATIKTIDQAKDWFNSENAKTSLKLMQSFYYQ